MGDGDFMIEHLNALNTLVIQLICVDIKMEEEDKCITLLCSLLDSWDNLVVPIGSSTKSIKVWGYSFILVIRGNDEKAHGKL